MNRRQFLTAAAAVPVAGVAAVAVAAPQAPLDPRRYLTSDTSWHLPGDFDTSTATYIVRERHSLIQPLPFERPSAALEGLLRDIEKYWRECYDLGPLLEDGTRGAPFRDEWTALYGDSV